MKIVNFSDGSKYEVDDRVFDHLVHMKNLVDSINPRANQKKTIANLCRGDCIEIGALSSPAHLPLASSIQYADINTAEESKLSLERIGYYGYHNKDFVKVQILFKSHERPLSKVPSLSKDCVYSSHSLEHSPNPIASLIDCLRVVKTGGIVYTIIPNKLHTYDRKRLSTDVNYLIQRYHSNIWTYTLDEYRDVFLNTDDHDVYKNKTEEDIVKAYEDNDGNHHIFVYDEQNTLSMIGFVCSVISANLVYFDSSNNFDIHFAIRKK